MLSSTTKNCWNGSKGSSPITLPSFSAESIRFLMQRFAMFKRFNLSTFHWASLFESGGALALNVLTKSFPKFSSVSSSSKLADAILFFFVVGRWPDVFCYIFRSRTSDDARRFSRENYAKWLPRSFTLFFLVLDADLPLYPRNFRAPTLKSSNHRTVTTMCGDHAKTDHASQVKCVVIVIITTRHN